MARKKVKKRVKSYGEGYTDGWSVGYRKGSNEFCGLSCAFGVLGGMVLLAVLLSLVYIGDGNDTVDVKELGVLMCEDKGMVYDYRDYPDCGIEYGDYPCSVPRIYCKEPYEEIEDGYLVLNKRGGS